MESNHSSGSAVSPSAALAEVKEATSRSDNEALAWMSAWDMRKHIARAELSAVDVVEALLARIERLNPKLNAFREILATDALAQARRADLAVSKGVSLGALHGVPVWIKEDTLVRGCTRYGSAGVKIATEDAIVVERLKAAGAIIVGTTTMPGSVQDANDPVQPYAQRNPWDLARTSGASSAGAAAAVSAGLGPVAISTDGAGSTRIPSALCGTFGFHSTPNRVPGVDYAHHIKWPGQSLGPITRNVRDAALVMDVIAGNDGRDMSAIAYPKPNYIEGLAGGINGTEFLWTGDFGFASKYAYPETPRVTDTVRAAAQGLVTLGCTVEPSDQVWEDPWPGFLGIAPVIGNRFMVDLYKLEETPESLRKALESRARNVARFERLLSNGALLIAPTLQYVAPLTETWADNFINGSISAETSFMAVFTAQTHLCNQAAIPAASVPCGFVDGLPVGLQIIGLPGQETQILRVADAFMKTFPQPPFPTL